MKPRSVLHSAWSQLERLWHHRNEKARSRQRQVRPVLEALEDRIVLAGFLIAAPSPGAASAAVPMPSPVQSYALTGNTLAQQGPDQFAVSPDSLGFTSATSV